MTLACSDEGPSRPYALAASGTQLLVTGPELGFQLTDADLASDVDFVAVHQEYYGVPWTEFGAGTDRHRRSGRQRCQRSPALPGMPGSRFSFRSAR